MISVVVGLYNEEEVLPSFIEACLTDIDVDNYELILVNDGSQDKTLEIIRKYEVLNPQIKVISYQPNKGLGNALRTGFDVAKGKIIVTMDSDLAHPPKYISRLVEAVENGCDLAIGSRYVKGGGIKDVPFDRDLLSKLTNLVSRLFILSNVKDLTSGFRAYDVDKLSQIKTNEKGFEIQLEIFVKFLKKNFKIKEVPFTSVDRQEGESKFSLVKDGLSYIRGLFKVFFYRWL